MGEAPSSAPRVIRVFVSSTFRDMQAERDELVKRVFPQIRRLCEQRGVLWSEIDLRWGVTDEQKAEGDVLDICLAEIDRSRPFFIGLLGQRYGWVPDAIPGALAERMGWLEEGKRSVTELEFLHGVLNDPDAAGHALFYLRDPAWLDTIDESGRAEYLEDDATGQAKLDELRNRVRSSQHPVRDFGDPIDLGRQVLADLTALVERLYPEATPPDPLDRQAAEHAAYAAARTVGYVARPALAELLDGWADSNEGPLLISAPSGAGSTALVASWAQGRRAQQPVVEHYVGANPAAAAWRPLTRRLIGELARITGEPPPSDDSLVDDVALRGALARALASTASAPQPVVVIIDGVDRLVDEDGAPDLTWVPAVIPPTVRLLLTAGAGADPQEPGSRPLQTVVHRGWRTETVPPLTEDERRQLITAFLARYAKGLDTVHVDRLATAEQTGSPLFLRTMLDELRQHGDHFTLGQAIEAMLAARTVDDLFEQLLARYERDFERDRPGLTAAVFRAIWAAHRGVSEAELLDLLGDGGEPLPRALLSPLFLAAEPHLVTRSGLLAFANHHMRIAVEDRYLTDAAAPATAHAKLATYFRGQPLGERVVDELAWQQIGAGDTAGLASTLADLAFFELAYRRAPADIRRWWARAVEAGISPADTYRGVVEDPLRHNIPSADGTTRQLVWGVTRILTDFGHTAEAARLNEFLVVAAREHPEASYEAKGTGDGGLRAALINHGVSLWVRGEAERAIAPLGEAIDRCRRAGDQGMLSMALGNSSLALRELGRIDEALAFSAEEETICRTRGDLTGLQACLGNRAELLRRRGENDAALALAAEQEAICRDLADRPGVARAQLAQAALLHGRGDLANALRLSAAHVATARELGDLRGLVEGLVLQVSVQSSLGDLQAATRLAAEGEDVARRLDDPSLLSRVLGRRAELLATAGDWPAAERVGREAELTARRAGDWGVVASALGIVGTARREQGDLPGCEATHHEQLAAAQRSGNPGVVAAAELNLGTACIAGQRFGDALAWYAKAEPVLRAAGEHSTLLPMLANRAQVHHSTGNAAAAIADYASAAQSAVVLGLHAQAKQWGEAGLGLAYQIGDVATAESMWRSVTTAARGLGDEASLQRALGEQALLLINRAQPQPGSSGAVDQALLGKAAVLLDEQEQICRRINDQVGLAACVGNRAIVLRYQGDLAGSLACIDQQLALATASGNAQGALFATANRGEVLGLLGRIPEALEALNQARATAAAYNIAPMVQQLDAMIQALQSRN